MERPVCSLIGYQPRYFSFKYDEHCLELEKMLPEQLKCFIKSGVKTIWVDVEIGIDLWAISLILELKERYPKLQLEVTNLCIKKQNEYSQECKNYYQYMLRKCGHSMVLVPETIASHMSYHTIANINICDYLVAIYDDKSDNYVSLAIEYSLENSCNKPEYFTKLIIIISSKY